MENKGEFENIRKYNTRKYKLWNCIRAGMYVMLKDEMEKLDKKPNYMTVPAAIRELEKIELVRQTDGKYRMDHAITATQKIILKAFDMDADQIQDKAVGLSRLLEKYAEEGK